MNLITNGYKRFSKNNSTDPRQRVPLSKSAILQLLWVIQEAIAKSVTTNVCMQIFLFNVLIKPLRAAIHIHRLKVINISSYNNILKSTIKYFQLGIIETATAFSISQQSDLIS